MGCIVKPILFIQKAITFRSLQPVVQTQAKTFTTILSSLNQNTPNIKQQEQTEYNIQSTIENRHQ